MHSATTPMRTSSITRPAPPRIRNVLGPCARRLPEVVAACRVDPLEQDASRGVQLEGVDETDVLQHLRSALTSEPVIVRQH